MTQGTIKTVRDDRASASSPRTTAPSDLFFHSSAVEHPTFDELREGQRVEFEAGSDPRNPARQRATHVRATDQE